MAVISRQEAVAVSTKAKLRLGTDKLVTANKRIVL